MSDTGRTLPHSLEAEMFLLGAVFVDAGVLPELRSRIGPDDFFQSGNRRIFRAMCRIDSRGEAIDPLTLAEDLKAHDDLSAAGGQSYIAELIDAVPTAAHAEHHARIVQQHATLRRLIKASQETIHDALRANGDGVAPVIEEAERRIFEAVEGRTSGEGFRAPEEAIFAAMELIEEEGKREGGVTGMATGIPTLDRMTTGLHPGDLTIVAGRPSMGKTALAWKIATHIADAGHTVAVSSLEMSEAQLVKRGLAMRGRVDLMKIRRGELEHDDYERLASAAGWLHNLPLRIDDRTAATVAEIRAKIRRLAAREGVGLVMVDYLQLMDAPGENRVQQVSALSRGLKRLAREFNVHVLAISQLSRAVEHRSPPRPQLSDLRDSGAIEQDADTVLLLWRPEYYFTDDTPEERWARWQGKGELIVAKQRNGPTDRILLHWDAPTTTFTELELVNDERAARRQRVRTG